MSIISASSYAEALPKWITASDSNVNNPNTWIAFRKDFYLTEKTETAIAQIAVDSKYWLWVNGNLAVFEGGLKRGPNPNDTYFDHVDILSYLKTGKNQIAVLLWYFGKNGFSHNDSGRAGFLFNLQMTNNQLVSDSSWVSKIHPAYLNTEKPYPNWRLPESNIRFDANLDISNWQIKDCAVEYAFKKSEEIALVGGKPWNSLVERPIPQWKDFSIKTAETKRIAETDSTYTIAAYLPYNMQMTPVIEAFDPVGGQLVSIETDHTFAGGDTNLRAEYITRKGVQEYESLGWLNGQKIILRASKSVDIRSVKYRETGYDTEQTGRFHCDDDFFVRFWEKGLRTLYVNMRDTYFDCPDRERAQWWGDVVVLMGESFYTFSPSTHLLMKKAIRELVDWQRADSTLFSPVPAGNYSDELPAQMLASVGYYGFWNYYMNTGDIETLKYVYPGVKKYLDIWKLDNTGLTEYRTGGWAWGDWGYDIDQRLLLAGWHYLALKGVAEMAKVLGYQQDMEAYYKTMEQIKVAFNANWNGLEYRYPDHAGKTDDRVHALAVLSGIAGKEKYDRIFEVFKTQWNASPYMEKYVMEALFAMNKGEYALQRTKERFSPMVNNREHTTLFEGWDIGNKDFGGGTTNHAWSGGALTVIGQYVCGIYPLEAGYKTFKIAPNPVFKETSITVPSVAGDISLEFKKSDKEFLLNISVPENTNAVVELPKMDFKEILVNGKKFKNALQFPAGNYSIKCIVDNKIVYK
ncbi:MAG: glycoside hydrolase [Dysgonamonadaceae bacterium]|nr:glycoside hydrolase [Dysgonamonadaceae bacterium]